jgi:prepilin-type processing-associated H-X9-DG protein
MRTFLIAAGILAGLVLLACLGQALPLEFLFTLAAGWVFFLARVVPEATINWMGVLTAVVCLAALAFGLHLFLKWSFRQIRKSAAEDAERRWPWRWTLALVSLVVILFVAGLAAAGLTQQMAWLLTSRERLTYHEREDLWRMNSGSKLKNVGMGLHDYHDSHHQFPPGGTFDAQGRQMHGWQTAILPYIEEEALYHRINRGLPWDHPDNVPHFKTVVRQYVFTAETTNAEGLALSHYAGNVRVLGGGEPVSLAQLTEGPGTATTVLAGEAAGNYKPWGYPANWRDPALGINRSPDGFGNRYLAGANLLFADGSVRYLTNEMDGEIVQALATKGP